MWEIRTNKQRTQHMSPTEEDKNKWIFYITDTKTNAAQEEGIPEEERLKKQREFSKFTTMKLKRWDEEKCQERYHKQLIEKLTQWKEEKEELLEAVLHKDLAEIEERYQSSLLSLDHEFQQKRRALRATCDET
eukprot:TRINITY_DN1759_c0_g1_i11.p1 TRINITY_DN1759_c0_g1~~TRINITY_DN1759_c0_g1_i11.p1  ORF type:complete len:133 (-),score=46.76 TRINITY_DN1759_c0_g1_i11:1378-1776(-)